MTGFEMARRGRRLDGVGVGGGESDASSSPEGVGGRVWRVILLLGRSWDEPGPVAEGGPENGSGSGVGSGHRFSSGLDKSVNGGGSNGSLVSLSGVGSTLDMGVMVSLA